MAGLLSDISIRVPEKKQEDNAHIPCGSSHHIGAYITITLKFQKLFILFVAAALNFQIRIKRIFFQHFTRIIQHFCEEIRMSLGTMELI